MRFIKFILDWFNKTTSEGRIKENVGTYNSASGGGRLEVQMLEKNTGGNQLLRFNLIRTSMISYVSLPIVLTVEEAEKLAADIRKSIKKRKINVRFDRRWSDLCNPLEN